MSKTKYIQDESFLAVLAVALFCIVLILWTYYADKKRNQKLEKQNETLDIYTKSLSWSVYIISGFALVIMIWEMIKRIISSFS